MAKTITDAPRKNMFMELPEDLFLITDETHPLYCPRVHLPLSESIVLGVMMFGVKEPVLVRKVGEQKQVIAGRQRVKHALEANKRLRAAGSAEHRVPVIYQNGDDKKMLGIMMLENEARQDTDPMEKAKNAQKLVDAGYTEKEAAAIFNVSDQSIRNWQSLLNLSAPVQEAISRREIKPTPAMKLTKLNPEKQKEKLEELKANGGRITVAKAKAVAEDGPLVPVKRMRTRKEVESEIARMEGCEDESSKGYLQGLEWVLCQ